MCSHSVHNLYSIGRSFIKLNKIRNAFSKLDKAIDRHLGDSNIDWVVKFLTLFSCFFIHRSSNSAHTIVMHFILVLLVIREMHRYWIAKKQNSEIKNPKIYFLDYYSAIVITTIALYLQRSGSLFTVYFFWLLDDHYTLKKQNLNITSFPYFHAICYLTVRIIEEWDCTLVSVSHIFISVLFYMVIFTAFRLAYRYVCEMEHFRTLYTVLANRIFSDRDVNIAMHRNEVAQKLHDSLGPLLLSSLITTRYLKILSNEPNKSVLDLQEEIENIEATLQKSIDQMRQCVNEINTITDSFNLTSEVNKIAERLDQLSAIHISFIPCAHIELINTQIKQMMYEIIRESVTNSIAHGNATEMEITVDMDDDVISLSISDNGSGCKHIMKSFGLKGIDNRVTKLNGQVSYESEVNKGFKTEINIYRNGTTASDSTATA